jgi:hypothetical protein
MNILNVLMVHFGIAKHNPRWPLADSATTRRRIRIERKVWGKILEVLPDTQELKFTSPSSKHCRKKYQICLHTNLQYMWIRLVMELKSRYSQTVLCSVGFLWVYDAEKELGSDSKSSHGPKISLSHPCTHRTKCQIFRVTCVIQLWQNNSFLILS